MRMRDICGSAQLSDMVNCRKICILRSCTTSKTQGNYTRSHTLLTILGKCTNDFRSSFSVQDRVYHVTEIRTKIRQSRLVFRWNFMFPEYVFVRGNKERPSVVQIDCVFPLMLIWKLLRPPLEPQSTQWSLKRIIEYFWTNETERGIK